MAPTASCSFYDNLNGKKFDKKHDFLGGILIFTSIRDMKKKRNVSDNHRNMALCRLKKETSKFLAFKVENELYDNILSLNILEEKFKIRINIWSRNMLSDPLINAVESSANLNYENLHFLSKQSANKDILK